MKRILYIIVSLVLLLTLTSCNNDYTLKVYKTKEERYAYVTNNFVVVESYEEYKIMINKNENYNDFKHKYNEKFFENNTLIIIHYTDDIYMIDKVEVVSDANELRFLISVVDGTSKYKYYFYEFSNEYLDDFLYVNAILMFEYSDTVSDHKFR